MGECKDCAAAEAIHVAGSMVEVVLNCSYPFVVSKAMISFANVSNSTFPFMLQDKPSFLWRSNGIFGRGHRHALACVYRRLQRCWGLDSWLWYWYAFWDCKVACSGLAWEAFIHTGRTSVVVDRECRRRNSEGTGAVPS